MPAVSRRLALVIASSHYTDQTLRQLPAPAGDAAALARVLADPAVGNFEVKVLIDRPSFEARREIEAFFASRTRDDFLLLYFSGHGLKTDDGKLYLATVDTERGLPLATTVPAGFVNEAMTACPSRRQVLILDCCHSGAFASGMVAKGGASADIRERFEGRGRVVLTASNAIQFAFEGDQVTGEGRRSVFTRHLVYGLETGEADLDGDGQIALAELYDYAYARVVDETPKQLPGMWAFQVEGSLVVARSPRGPRPPGTAEASLAELYRRGMEALAVGRWQEAAALLGDLADAHPEYLDAAERVRPLRDLAARLAALGPAARGWRWAVSRLPILAAVLAVNLPNGLASYFNFAYNRQALIRGDARRDEVFLVTAAAVNGLAFPLGLVILVLLARPVARGLRQLRAGREVPAEELGRLRGRCLDLGHYAAAIGTGFWALAGPVYPTALHLAGSPLSPRDSVFFVVSLALGGLVAAAYPFFGVTFLWVRVLYPPLVRPGSTTAEDRFRLERLEGYTWWYLLLAGSVPMATITLALWAGSQTRGESSLLPILTLGSLAGLGGAFWLDRALQRDLRVLKQVVTRSRPGKGAG